jgi:phosphoenolpyruvate-protein phosphotransferase
MTLEYSFTCPLANGIHARPANDIEQVVSQFDSEVMITNRRNAQKANARSVLSIISSDIKYNDACDISIDGPNKQEALESLRKFFEYDLEHCDDDLEDAELFAGEKMLPVSLVNTGAKLYEGTAVSRGIGKGVLINLDGFSVGQELEEQNGISAEDELGRYYEAVTVVKDRLITRSASSISKTERSILKTHVSLVVDVKLNDKIVGFIKKNGHNIAGAIRLAVEYFSDVFNKIDNPLLQERILDIQDICSQLLSEVYGLDFQNSITLEQDAICIADNLTPSQFLALDKKLLKGLVLCHAGTTSHTVILSRSFGIPTITGVKGRVTIDRLGQQGIIDGNIGVLVTSLNDETERFFCRQIEIQKKLYQRNRQCLDKENITADGKQLSVFSNISMPQECESVFDDGAEGVGLFRTEMLYLASDEAPTEGQQFDSYRAAVESAQGKTVIIRTFDIGGDKKVAYLDLPEEENPSLGYSAVRIYKEYEGLFKTQLRAILRASAYGKVWVMIPMVSCVQEVTWVKKKVEQVKSELDESKVAYDPDLPLGIMVEIPSAADIIDKFSEYVDFFSIGTNDLLQYFIDSDRVNEKLTSLNNPLHPSFLKLLRQIVKQAKDHNKWIGICGEMASNPDWLPIMIGLGLDEISVSSPCIAEIKRRLSLLNSRQCSDMLEKLILCETAEKAGQAIEKFNLNLLNYDVIDEEMIIVDSSSNNKHEVIKEAVDNLYVNHRCTCPVKLENHIWQREQVYSTGLGYEIAIPHCRSNAVTSNSICVVKLRTPVEWGSTDNKPVKIVIMLVVRDSETENVHMKLFSKLARKIMRKEFRKELLNHSRSDELLEYLKKELEV